MGVDTISLTVQALCERDRVSGPCAETIVEVEALAGAALFED